VENSVDDNSGFRLEIIKNLPVLGREYAAETKSSGLSRNG